MESLESFKGSGSFKGGWRAMRNNVGFLVLLGTIFLILVAAWVTLTIADRTTIADSFLALPMGALTLIVAAGIGWNNMRRTWIDSLPWVLCVRLQKPTTDDSPTLETFAVLEDIPLAAPANAREWAQNLASQLSDNPRLSLGVFTVDTVDRLLDSNQRRMCITLKLTQPSFEFKKGYESGKVWTASPASAILQQKPNENDLDSHWSSLRSSGKPED